MTEFWNRTTNFNVSVKSSETVEDKFNDLVIRNGNVNKKVFKCYSDFSICFFFSIYLLILNLKPKLRGFSLTVLQFIMFHGVFITFVLFLIYGHCLWYIIIFFGNDAKNKREKHRMIDTLTIYLHGIIVSQF